jgi:AbrB family looped-hinge helix DNA binding protein
MKIKRRAPSLSALLLSIRRPEVPGDSRPAIPGPARHGLSGASGAAKPATRSEVTRLSTKGQLIIPKEIRVRHGWTAGTELIVEDHGSTVVLRPVENLPITTVKDLVGCAGYRGPSLSLEEMEAGIARGARERR